MQKILLGITGSIAAYKTPDLVRRLREQGYEVKAVLTEAAKAFVTPLSLQAVSGNEVREGLFDVNAEAAMSHIELARWADCIVIAPGSADFIAKLAHGFANDLLSTLCLATQAKIVLAPAMNQAMWSNVFTQENVKKLMQAGMLFIGPAEGSQACGDTGLGRMLEPMEIIDELNGIMQKPLLSTKRILITAGPTQEPIDPVRYLSNRSSGKMGYALAKAAIEMGAIVTLITGPVAITAPINCMFIKVKTAEEMLKAVEAEIASQDIFISAAAVADYRPIKPASQKIKKSQASFQLELEPTIDILASVAALSPRPFIVGFAAETNNVLAFAEEKRLRKGVDLMVVNDVSDMAIGFESDNNAVTVLSEQAPIVLAEAPKIQLARQLLGIVAKCIYNV
ncbi:MAG: bifunctional phosphopantothenoylcysteine decarboxylase/phosphopantothenate--cysteine ligase CoaBC [Gammaproteobacteria bacterium]|nr:bifunctional phosphopantothenoylcysteine decarboxylase/phosphopantothenate--cysteine ligase CoaBC [Gammaproteobacteria bacterium]